jgi:hypothetical protein
MEMDQLGVSDTLLDGRKLLCVGSLYAFLGDAILRLELVPQYLKWGISDFPHQNPLFGSTTLPTKWPLDMPNQHVLTPQLMQSKRRICTLRQNSCEVWM